MAHSRKSREFFSTTGQSRIPETREDRAARLEFETQSRRRFVQAEGRNGNMNEKVDKVLRLIDFPLLHHLFVEFYKSLGHESDEINFLSRNYISTNLMQKNEEYMGHGISGCYDPEKNIIGTFHDPKYGKEKEPLTSKEKQEIIHTLIHEEVHATNKNRCYGPNWSRAKARMNDDYYKPISTPMSFERSQSGVAQSIPHRTFFRALDEGLTEIRARKLFLKYCEADGNLLRNDAVLYVKMIEEDPDTQYYSEVQMVRALIEYLSKKLGVDVKTITMSLELAQVEGLDLLDEQIKSELDEILDSRWLEKLSEVYTQRDADRLTDQLKYFSSTDL